MTETEEATTNIYRDFSACLLAIANALETKGVLTKHDIAQSATERLLALKEELPAEHAAKLLLLAKLATRLEQVPGD